MIDNFGHLGGLMGGAAAAYVVGPRLRRTPHGLVVDEPLVRLPATAATRTAMPTAGAARPRRRRRQRDARRRLAGASSASPARIA